MTVKVGHQKVVSFTYQILDDQGTVHEQSDIPMSYVHGVDARVFPKVAEALEGKKPGDEVEVVLTPENGFGEYNPDLTFSDVVKNVPPEFQHIGAEAEFQNDAGESITMKVVKIENGKVYLDANHMFAGKTMTFKIKVHSIREATSQELDSGIPQDKMKLQGLH